jgi:hypothetical protein
MINGQAATRLGLGRLGELVAEAAVVPPGDGGVGGQVGVAEDG